MPPLRRYPARQGPAHRADREEEGDGARPGHQLRRARDRLRRRRPLDRHRRRRSTASTSWWSRRRRSSAAPPPSRAASSGSRATAGRSRIRARAARGPGSTWQAETGNFFQDDMIEAFLDTGPEMLDWFERETEVRFVPTLYPDYHPTMPGGVDVGRSVLAAPFDASTLGPEMRRLAAAAPDDHLHRHDVQLVQCRPQALLPRHQVAGLGALCREAPRGARLRARPLPPRHPGDERQRAGRAARQDLLLARHPDPHRHPGRGADPRRRHRHRRDREGPAGPVRITARRGVVLACGGFPHDAARTAEAYPHLRRGGEHFSPCRAATPATASASPRTPGARWRSASRPPPPGCRSPRFRTATAASPPSPTSSTATSPASSRSPQRPALLQRVRELPRRRRGDHRGLRRRVRDRRLADLRPDAIAKHGLATPSRPCPRAPVRKGYPSRARPSPISRAPAASTPPGWRRRSQTTTAAPSTAATSRSTAARPRSTATSPTRSASRTLASRRSRGPFYAVSWSWAPRHPTAGRPRSRARCSTPTAAIPGLDAVGNNRASIMGGNYPGAGITLARS